MKIYTFLNYAPRPEGVLGVEVYVHAFLISVLGQCSVSSPQPLYPQGRRSSKCV